MSAPKNAKGRLWDSLRQRAQFLHIQQNGHKWVTPAFVIYVLKPDSLPRPQVGFTVTKKLGNAVIRNRIRRRLRAVTDKAQLPSWQMVLIGREDALEKDFNDLSRDLKWALGKLDSRLQENKT